MKGLYSFFNINLNLLPKSDIEILFKFRKVNSWPVLNGAGAEYRPNFYLIEIPPNISLTEEEISHLRLAGFSNVFLSYIKYGSIFNCELIMFSDSGDFLHIKDIEERFHVET